MAETELEYRVYSILHREEADPFWFQIGKAFPHKEQEGGFTIRLNALPVSPKLVIRVFDPEEQNEEMSGSAPAATKPPATTAKTPAAEKTKA